jgi:hypothetical protein
MARAVLSSVSSPATKAKFNHGYRYDLFLPELRGVGDTAGATATSATSTPPARTPPATTRTSTTSAKPTPPIPAKNEPFFYSNFYSIRNVV